MRKILLIGTVLVLPMNAMAQTAPSLAESVPTPGVEANIDGYRVAAISVGAVAGVLVANAVTGGMVTPVLLWGAGDAGLVAAAPAATAAQTAVTAAGALIGGYIGNWVYDGHGRGGG